MFVVLCTALSSWKKNAIALTVSATFVLLYVQWFSFYQCKFVIAKQQYLFIDDTPCLSQFLRALVRRTEKSVIVKLTLFFF
jgi:hypothetical protein